MQTPPYPLKGDFKNPFLLQFDTQTIMLRLQFCKNIVEQSLTLFLLVFTFVCAILLNQKKECCEFFKKSYV